MQKKQMSVGQWIHLLFFLGLGCAYLPAINAQNAPHLTRVTVIVMVKKIQLTMTTIYNVNITVSITII